MLKALWKSIIACESLELTLLTIASDVVFVSIAQYYYMIVARSGVL